VRWTLAMIIIAAACLGAPGAGVAAPPLRTLSQGVNATGSKPEKLVVRTLPELQKLGDRIRPAGNANAREIPKVDFSHEMVLAVFLGTRPTAGFKVEIKDVREAGGKLVVKVEETKPPKDAILAQVITSPYHVVVVKKSELPVAWD